jgi:hypothetical protein
MMLLAIRAAALVPAGDADIVVPRADRVCTASVRLRFRPPASCDFMLAAMPRRRRAPGPRIGEVLDR